MDYLKANHLSLLIIVYLVLTSVGFNPTQMLGASPAANLTRNTNPQLFTNTVEVDGNATFDGGTVTITTANTATSTLIVGCVQTYATSTATPIKYQATTTAHPIAPVYGTCPNL